MAMLSGSCMWRIEDIHGENHAYEHVGLRDGKLQTCFEQAGLPVSVISMDILGILPTF
jgi:hypothetical protein